jgi:hypothetical protein
MRQVGESAGPRRDVKPKMGLGARKIKLDKLLIPIQPDGDVPTCVGQKQSSVGVLIHFSLGES